MANFSNSLDRVKIAAPCSADWDQMFSFEGERVRFCSQCNLNVYNLSSMTRDEATALIARTEGRLCVRFYRRSDGTVLTQNCPVGLRALKRRVVWVAQLLLGMILGLLADIGLAKLVDAIGVRASFSSSRPEVIGAIMPPVERRTEPNIEVAELPAMGQVGPVPTSGVTIGKVARKERAFLKGRRNAKAKLNRPEME
jgi:hypothetical protein